MGNQISQGKLRKAIEGGRVNDVKALFDEGFDPNFTFLLRGGETPLHVAAYEGQKDVVALLIAKGANVNQADKDGRTPLHRAAYGHKDVVAMLIAHEANVNQANDYGGTPLQYAACNGHKDVVELLIANGANVNQANDFGWTPLYNAARDGHKDVVALLIAKGANVNQADNWGETPLYIAAEKKRIEVISLLLQANADVDCQTKRGLTPLMIARKNNHKDIVDILTKAKEKLIVPTVKSALPDLTKAKKNLFFDAVKSGDVNQLRLLLPELDNANIMDEDGNTLLHLAIANSQPLILEMLLRLPTIQLQSHNKKKQTSFILAMKLRNRQMIKTIDTAINKPMEFIDIQDLKYDSKDFLGKGSFGAVYKATYKNEMVAIKKILKQVGDSDEFEREINAMLHCRSPFLLHLVGVAEVNTNEPKLALQYMDGGDLRKHLDKQRNNEPTVTNYSTLEIIWAIANGLADIHHNNCVHRDLKSHNVLLSTKHYIKLADLGLTRDVTSMMTQGVGTLYWTAPEVLKDIGRYGAPADIYSFGVVLTELDTLLLPYSNLQLTPLVIQNRVCDGSLRPALSNKCKPWYNDLVERCLNGDPKLRPSAFDVVAIIEKQFLQSDNEDEDDFVDKRTEPQPEVESLNTSSRATTTSASSSNSKVPIASQPLAASDINCPSCKEPNSLLNDVCMKCSKALLKDSIKINILIKRLESCSLNPCFICSICHFENDIKSTNCTTCQEDLVDADKVSQLVAQLNEAP